MVGTDTDETRNRTKSSFRCLRYALLPLYYLNIAETLLVMGDFSHQ